MAMLPSPLPLAAPSRSPWRLLETLATTGALALTLCLTPLGGHSENADEAALAAAFGGGEYITVATGTTRSLRDTPAVATVITAEDITRIGATDLGEALETVPGLHMSVNATYLPVFSIRGIHTDVSPQVLVLVNGIPQTNVFDGQLGRVWISLPVRNISRIEVIRGPGSALYGADAFSGVINIITKNRTDLDGLTVGGRVGSFDRRDWFGTYGGNFSGFETAFTIEGIRHDGHNRKIDADSQSFLDPFFVEPFFGAGASLAPGNVSVHRDLINARADFARGPWRIRLGYLGGEGGAGVGAAQALDPKGVGDARRISNDLTFDEPRFRENLGLTVQASFYDVRNLARLRLFPPGAAFPDQPPDPSPLCPGGLCVFPDGVLGNPDVYERHYRLETSTLYSGFAKHTMRTGVGYRLEDQYRVEESKNFFIPPGGMFPEPLPGGITDVSDTVPFSREEDRTVRYFFAQDEWDFVPDWTLTTGARVDDYSDFGTTVNPRLALVWQTSYRLTTKALYGRAFRAPSFQELFNINNPNSIGNPDLDPETINTWEIVFDYRPQANLRSAINFYYYEMDDIIRFVSGPGLAGPTAQNTGRQTGYGVEAELSWQALRGLRVSGNYAYQHSTDEEADDDVGLAPTHQAYLRADWKVAPQWNLNGQVTGIFGRKREPLDSRREVDDYVTFDLTLRGDDFTPGWGVAFSARNLFNADAREPSFVTMGGALIPHDLPLAGRNVYIELSRRFE
jgi:outer membrane receptor protein involved in Fe transport